MNLNDFIEQKIKEFIDENHCTCGRDHLIDGLQSEDVSTWLRSALKDCAEKTVEALHAFDGDFYSEPFAERARAWLGNDQPHASND